MVTVFHATKARNFIAQQSYKKGNLGLFPFACARMLAIRALSLLASICKYFLFLPRGFRRVNSQSSHLILSIGSRDVDCNKMFQSGIRQDFFL